MGTAVVLAPIHLSFTTMHLAMSALGIALCPWVYVPLSVISSLVVILRTLRHGDSLLGEAVRCVRNREYDSAYTAAWMASKRKWLLKPSQKAVSTWRRILEDEKLSREMELDALRSLADEVREFPRRRPFIGATLGIACGLLIGLLGVSLHLGSPWIVAFCTLSCGLYGMERHLSRAVHRLLTRAPVLNEELHALSQLCQIGFI